MIQKLEQLQVDAINAIKSVKDLNGCDDIKVKYLGKKGEITAILKGLGSASPEERPIIGQKANDVKAAILDAVESKNKELEAAQWNERLLTDHLDVSLPSIGSKVGSYHPINIVIKDTVEILKQLGFSVKEGPEIETDYYNFEALNIPQDHPARDMHDTFYLNSGFVLRTHTSPVQIHEMQNTAPPLKIIVPGKVFRVDADVSHSPVFHQIEGLYVDENVTFGQLKGTLEFFLKTLFGKEKKVRFRPSYFPFTEPSTEVDVECVYCSGKGCRVCKQTGWIEILGAGMVNRNVFRSVGYDPDNVTGFAFGLGIERIAMLRYEIPDIRLLYEHDTRFLSQF